MADLRGERRRPSVAGIISVSNTTGAPSSQCQGVGHGPLGLVDWRQVCLAFTDPGRAFANAIGIRWPQIQGKSRYRTRATPAWLKVAQMDGPPEPVSQMGVCGEVVGIRGSGRGTGDRTWHRNRGLLGECRRRMVGPG